MLEALDTCELLRLYNTDKRGYFIEHNKIHLRVSAMSVKRVNDYKGVDGGRTHAKNILIKRYKSITYNWHTFNTKRSWTQYVNDNKTSMGELIQIERLINEHAND